MPATIFPASSTQPRGYDQLPQRRFEFIPIWGFAVFLLYNMRRVACRQCGVKVEEVPWATGKHQLTKAYMLYLHRRVRAVTQDFGCYEALAWTNLPHRAYSI